MMKTTVALVAMATILFLGCNGVPRSNNNDNDGAGQTTVVPPKTDPTPEEAGVECFINADCYDADSDECSVLQCHNGKCEETAQIMCPEEEGLACWHGECVIKEKSCGSDIDDNDPCTVEKCNHVTGKVERWDYTCPQPDDPNRIAVCMSDNNGERICVEQAKEFCQADDGNKCTLDLCDTEGNPVYVDACDDGKANTKDSCDPNVGQCHHEFLPPACLDKCKSADPCQDAVCNWETGECEFESHCDPNNQWCEAGICHAICTEGTDCFDGNECTKDQCLANGHCSNTSISCDDGDPDTFDSCEAAIGCKHVEVIPGDDQCVEQDGDVCTVPTVKNGTCIELNPCGPGTVCQPQGGLASCAPAITASDCTEGQVTCIDFASTKETGLSKCNGGLWVQKVPCGATSSGAIQCSAQPNQGCSKDGGKTWFGWDKVM